MEPLKEMFNPAFYERLARQFAKADPRFDAPGFVKAVTRDLAPLSLNQRMRRTTEILKDHLPENYKQAIRIMEKVIPHTPRGYTNLLFPDFVGVYGRRDFDTSMQALKRFTTYGSSEFAIREFLKQDLEATLRIMKTWAGDPDPHVRRLASEGSRPRLPWSFHLEEIIRQPALTAPILQRLSADEALYVRKSVANHLNDISKDSPGFMLDLVGGWDKTHPSTAWIIKHACRTLIKKGHPGSLAVFDFEKNPRLRVEQLKADRRELRLGDTLRFSFALVSEKKTGQKLVVDYIIHYRKKSGELSPKVFKLKETGLRPGETLSLSKSQTIQDLSTRKHFPGEHRLEIQVNGKVLAGLDFTLSIP